MIEPVVAAPGSRRWIALGVLFVTQMIATGIPTFGFSLFVKPLSAEFGLSRAEAGSGLVCMLVGVALWSPLVGRAIDRLMPSKVMLTGALLYGAGLTVVALSQSIWLDAAAAVLLIGAGMAMLGPLCGSALTARWFPDCAGRVLGVISASASIGGTALIPVLSWAMQAYGWRAALGGTAAAVAIFVALPVVIVVRGSVNAKPRPATATGGAATGSTRQILVSGAFWLLVLIFGSSFAIVQSIVANLLLFVEGPAVNAQRGVFLISALSLSGIAGKFLTGWLLDRGVDVKILHLGALSLLAAFMGSTLAGTSYEWLIVSCICAGMAVGAVTLNWIASVKLAFGSAALGSVPGLMVPLQMPFVFGWLFVVGAVYDHWNSYTPLFQLSLACLAATGMLTLCIRRTVPPAGAQASGDALVVMPAGGRAT